MGQVYLFALAVAAAYVVGSLLGREARRKDLEAVDQWRSGELPTALLPSRLGSSPASFDRSANERIRERLGL